MVPPERLMDEAREVAHKLMQAAPLAQIGLKRAVYRALLDPSVADFMAPTGITLWETEYSHEGAKAFAEKREPQYKGR